MGKIRSCLVFQHLSFESFGTTQDSSKYHIKRNRDSSHHQPTRNATRSPTACRDALWQSNIKQYCHQTGIAFQHFTALRKPVMMSTHRAKKSKQMQWRATLARKPLGDIDIDILILTNIIKLDQACRPQKCPKCFRGFSVAVFVLELFQITTAKSLSQKSTASI